MSIKNFSMIAVIALLFISGVSLLAGNTGIISGSIVDSESGDKIIGASVRVINNAGKITTGGRSKTDGTFRITNVSAGVYVLKVTYVGYQTAEIYNFEVKPGEVAKTGIKLRNAAIYTDVITVTAKRVMNNDAALLNQRQKAGAASDGIGAEEIAAIGASDAGAVMSKMTGATMEGGKHIIMRGLGDRYVNAQLNGAALASADPDKKSVDFDLFPSSLLENIIVTKTATPDKPGDFTGGTVNISTKSFPDKFTTSTSYSTSYNSQVTSSSFLTNDGGSTDWLGMDDGSRSVPDVVANAVKNDDIPTANEAYSDYDKAMYLDELSKAFSAQMKPTKKSAPMNQSFGFSVGNQYEIAENKTLGFVGSLSYNNSYKSYNDGELNFYKLAGSDLSNITELDREISVSDSKSTNEVLWGALANVALSLNSENTISFNLMYNQSGENESRYQIGNNKYWDTEGLFESSVLKYTERNLTAMQFSGDHQINALLKSKLNWQISYNINTQVNPDLRYFSDELNISGTDTVYSFQASNYDYPAHYYRDLSEDLISGKLDYEIPLKPLMDRDFTVKVGGLYSQKSRSFVEDVYKMEWNSGYFKDNYTGDANVYFENNTGFDSLYVNPYDPQQRERYIMGNYINHLGSDDMASAYSGTQNIAATYGMLDWKLTNKLRMLGGVRWESTYMHVQNDGDPEKIEIKEGKIDKQDFLPSVNIIYTLSDKQNLRMAYGKTIARPNFREFAPYHSYEYAVGYVLIGNQHLERSIIDNIDIRWEWFPNIGEIFAVSTFYKDFSNPIERVILNVNKEVQYQNVDHALLAGAEIEFKKNLQFLGDFAKDLTFGANFTYTYSRVDISEDELLRMRAYDPEVKDYRQLQGQSPYVLNVNLSYANADVGRTAGVYFNVFGKRLSEVSLGGTPDVYEYSRPDLSFNVSQDLFRLFGAKDAAGNSISGLKLKFSAKNLLDSEIYKAQEFKGNEFVNLRYNLGRSFSVGLSYAL